MKSVSKPGLRAMIAVVVVVLLGLGLYFFAVRQASSSDELTLEQRQQSFVDYADTVQLQDALLVYESAAPLCAGSRTRGSTDKADCTLSKTAIYKLDGRYQEESANLFAYLKSKGFDFQQGDPDEDKTRQKLRDAAIADNLADTEPIIVDIYNTRQDVRLRVSLGDRARTLPRVSGQLIDTLSDDQLVVGLQFYNP